MTTMLTEVYDAFVSAGVPDEKARKAAEALSGNERRFDRLESNIDLRFAAQKSEMDSRFASLERNLDARFANVDARFGSVESRFASLKSEMDTRFAKVDGELLLLKWMTGFTLALVFATFAKQFVH